MKEYDPILNHIANVNFLKNIPDFYNSPSTELDKDIKTLEKDGKDVDDAFSKSFSWFKSPTGYVVTTLIILVIISVIIIVYCYC